MLKNLLCAALIFCFSMCVADQIVSQHYSLVVTLDPGESLMVKTSDGEFGTFLDYRGMRVSSESGCIHKGIGVDDSYHLEYHLIIWAQCPGCTTFYNAAEGGCRNPYCPSKHS